MPRWVLLRHTLPDGTSHLDWMLDRGDGEGLLSFRLGEGTDVRSAAVFMAERIGDHRREYLDYEGPVSGGRGMVARVDSGEAVVSEGEGVIRIWLGGREWVGRPRRGSAAGEWWGFELASGADSGHTG